jgi:hypothetical protein
MMDKSRLKLEVITLKSAMKRSMGAGLAGASLICFSFTVFFVVSITAGLAGDGRFMIASSNTYKYGPGALINWHRCRLCFNGKVYLGEQRAVVSWKLELVTSA